MKKFICTLVSLLVVFVACICTACSNDTIPEKSEPSKKEDMNSSISNESLSSEISSLESSENTKLESEISLEEKSDDVSNKDSDSKDISEEISDEISEETSGKISEEISDVISEETSDEISETQSQISSEVSKKPSETSKLTDVTEKYPKPQVDESSIITQNGIYYMSDDINFKDYADYIMENFNGKIYKPGDIIDVKANVASQENPEVYYKIYENIYRKWNFATMERPFEEIEANFDDFNMKYIINDNQNLVLRYSQDYVTKLYIYFEDEYFYILVTKA